LVKEEEARQLAAQADFTLVLSFTTPDCYTCYPNAVNVGLTFWETDRFPLQGKERSPWAGYAKRMDALWAPCTHIKQVFETAGVTIPIRVIPWPIRAPKHPGDGLPEGEVYDLDRQPLLGNALLALARFHENRFQVTRWWMKRGGPRAGTALLAKLRCPSQSVSAPREHGLLCVAQDVPRKGLLLLLAEWMEFKQRPEAGPWSLILKSTSIDPQMPKLEFVSHFWVHVQALKRQLHVPHAGVYLWTGNLSGEDFNRLLANTFGQIAPSLGEGFCGPAALALALGKPLVAPRHTAFADYIPEDYPYHFPTRAVHISFARDPLRVYDPSSLWHVPERLAVADALSRLVSDVPARRAEVCWRACARLADWCSPERVRGLLAEEVQRLASTTRPVAA
jgi:glycosyltransferase involved in cell wall biosynthesis